MSNEISNIANLKIDLGSIQALRRTGAAWPLKNSIVEINVLDKTPNAYKLFINGKLFVSKLPVSVEKGDILAGKVQSANPLTILLNNLTSGGTISQSMITDIINKLGIPSSKISQATVKSFISNEKPLVKNKLTALIELLSDETDIEEWRLDLIVKLFFSSENSSQLYKELSNVFKQSPYYHAGEALNIVRSLIRKNSNQKIMNLLRGELIVDAEDEQSLLKALTGGLERKKKIIRDLRNLLNESVDPDEKDDLKKLLEHLKKYFEQKKYFAKLNYYPDFLIVKNKNSYELAEYSIEKRKNGNGDKTFKFDLSMSPERLEKIRVEGAYLPRKISGEFSAKSDYENEFVKNFSKLKNLLETKINMEAGFSFKNLNSVNRKNSFSGIQKNLNVTA